MTMTPEAMIQFVDDLYNTTGVGDFDKAETMLTDEIFLRAEGSATFYDTLDLKYEDTATPYSYWDISPTVLKASIGLGFKF